MSYKLDLYFSLEGHTHKVIDWWNKYINDLGSYEKFDSLYIYTLRGRVWVVLVTLFPRATPLLSPSTSYFKVLVWRLRRINSSDQVQGEEIQEEHMDTTRGGASTWLVDSILHKVMWSSLSILMLLFFFFESNFCFVTKWCNRY